MKKEFEKRIYSSLIIIPISLFFVVQGGIFLIFFFSIFFLVTSYEWYKMTKRKYFLKFIGIVFLFLSFYTTYLFREELGLYNFLFSVLICISTDIGGYVFGRAGDKYGPRLCTLASLICWMISLSLAIIATEFNQIWLIYVTGVIGGFNIGGIFAVDRLFMTRLSPEKHLGEFYGLYSTVGRFATIVGPLLWGFIVNTLGLGRNPAMFSLIILLIISFFIIKGVSDNQYRN